MKANIGIRRRLAPLLDNDINQMELFTALLLSLPGSPVLYYGDEIGMGDNIWLGDRDGVRTPMQWSGDRNAGFSTANPGKLDRPLVMDPVYGYQAVNVEAQMEDQSSLLRWTQRMIHARKLHPAFGSGRSTTWAAPTRRCLPTAASWRTPMAAPTSSCASTTSRASRSRPRSTCAASRQAARRVLGGVSFPSIGELPYLLTLGGYGFYWFRLVDPVEPAAPSGEGELL